MTEMMLLFVLNAEIILLFNQKETVVHLL